MNNPILLMRYKFYKFLVNKKNQRAINAEQKFIKKLSPTQKEFYEKVLDLLQDPYTEVVSINSHILLKKDGIIITIDVFLNESLLSYTSKTEKGTFHAEQKFGEDSKLFFMQHVETNLMKKRRAILDAKNKIVEILVA